MPRVTAKREEARFREIFRRVHAHHPACQSDEWLSIPCRSASGRAVAPIVWSRRNGPWRRVEVLFVGAAPGNAGGKGRGALGAHGTRIPFGGDIAGANLEVLLGSAGLTRNDVFITAALNRLPQRGGGEPTPAEIRAPVGDYASSLHLLRDTLLATGPALLVALGNVALRCIAACVTITEDIRMPGLQRLEATGLQRGKTMPLVALHMPDEQFTKDWQSAWRDAPMPDVVWLVHPSGQNMSPFARRETAFHTRLLDARRDLRNAVQTTLRRQLPAERPPIPDHGIYALREWRELIAPRLQRFDALWRNHGV
jgi:uracil-DNA glycosylase family 4